MSLKKLLFSIVVITLFLGCSEKKESSFRISGELKNIDQKELILYKIEDILKKELPIIDTIKVDNFGKFNAVYFLESGLYSLKINNSKQLPLAITNGEHLNISGNSLESIKVSGSKATQLLEKYESFRNESLNRLVRSIRLEIKEINKKDEPGKEELITKLREKEVSNYKIHLNELTSFINENMQNSMALYATSSRWNSENIDSYKALVSNFEIAYPTLTVTKKLQEKIILLEKTSIGSIFENVELPNRNKELISLASKKSTYTLIDFWASWCPPCRTESSLLNELYSNYHNEGFEIYGISLDTFEKRWLNALKKDNRTWPNVSSLEGFKSKEAQNLGITALPTNFLIDATGKIVAVNLHGEELKKKIESLFSRNSN